MIFLEKYNKRCICKEYLFSLRIQLDKALTFKILYLHGTSGKALSQPVPAG